MRQCKAGIDTRTAVCRHLVTLEDEVFPLVDLVAVAQRGDVIYPYLKPIDSVQNAPDSDLWHTLIDADNYHALQLLAYLYPGMVDCIYIDPPYNKPDSHDWKYNCDYVDGTDAYRHSKWLAMIEARLRIAKKLLNPKDSVLIVTIDELEYHHLGCLLEQMFPEARIQMVSLMMNPGGVSRHGEFSRTDEYVFFVKIGISSPSPLLLDKDWLGGVKNTSKNKLHWDSLMRTGTSLLRSDAPRCFYPIYVSSDGKRFLGAGDPLELNEDRSNITPPAGSIAIFPIHLDGTEGNWQYSKEHLLKIQKKGYVKLGRLTPRGMAISYLKSGNQEKVENGTFEIIGRREDGSIIVNDSDYNPSYIPGTQWMISLHDATRNGSNLLRSILDNKRFSFPKSLYAVHDTIRFFVANKPNALVLDFFAGSGTTLHAVNLLNKEDGGNRRCIMVTNNEIGEPKEKELSKKGIKPGDEEWEKWGIARYVNWPRTKCSILGVDVNNKPIEGEYITSLTETKTTDRKFTQINYMAEGATLRQKKALVTLINKQKDVKLPAMKEDVPFLVSEENDCNASILFDINEEEAWMEALDGNSHITTFYIVAEKDAEFKAIKTHVSDLMGQIEEPVPVKISMKDGFKANAAFFKLGFLDKRSVARGRQLTELLPVLWMKAGAKGECPTELKGNYAILSDNKMAILKDEKYFPRFREEMKQHSEIEVVYLITDSSNAYLSMIEELKGVKTYQLYRDYLENFRINYATK
ncbi:MAG: site-specific DNA-methyltransferase [Bacteroidaceae bacterium]|nr:site-specific DNA-methyltransferase [Bacteroidaceae bacterium]